MRVRFALITEGSSDRGLVEHLEALCRRAGATEAEGHAPDLGRLPSPVGKSVSEQIETMMKLDPGMDLLFIHRDADHPQDEGIRSIIDRGVAQAGLAAPHVKVVPIQELEAWLLLDETEIRHVAGKPRGKQALDLPPPHTIEDTKSPKERLEQALVIASGLTGQRLVRFKKQLPQWRASLLQRLDIDGPIQGLRAWQTLVADIEAAIAAIERARSSRKT